MSSDQTSKSTRERSNAPREASRPRSNPSERDDTPAAGAHAAHHLVNEDATPGAGALPSPAHRSGKEVDGGAG